VRFLSLGSKEREKPLVYKADCPFLRQRIDLLLSSVEKLHSCIPRSMFQEPFSLIWRGAVSVNRRAARSSDIQSKSSSISTFTTRSSSDSRSSNVIVKCPKYLGILVPWRLLRALYAFNSPLKRRREKADPEMKGGFIKVVLPYKNQLSIDAWVYPASATNPFQLLITPPCSSLLIRYNENVNMRGL